MLGNTSGEIDVDDPADSPPAPNSSLPAPPADAPAPAPASRVASRDSALRWFAALVIVSVIGAGSYVMTGGQFAMALMRGHGDLPPPGTIWFASSFDPDTFEIDGRLDSVGPDDTFFMVGQLTRSVAGSRLVIRAYLDGELIHIAFTARTDEAGIWGFNMGPSIGPGTWRYEIADIGGDVLASGQIVAKK